ncbi:MAG TPA: polyprenol phosphomannose-dependent alpha 1,6 mannosyltransferase MptB [Gaiellaceae bacterium]
MIEPLRWLKGGDVLAIAAGALISLAVAVAASAAAKAGYTRSSPLVPPGHWLSVLQASVVLAFGAYLLGLARLWRRRTELPLVLGFGAVIQLLPLFGPVLLSTDVFGYSGYADMSSEGRDPYVETPTNSVPSLYGPIFTLLSEAIWFVTGGAAEAAQLTHRAIAATSILVTAFLASKLARDAAFAAAFVSWNPLLAFHFGGGGHNDALLVAVILAGLLIGRRTAPWAEGSVWAVSVFVKWVSLALAPIEAAALVRRTGWRQTGGFALAFVACAAAIGLLTSLRYEWLDAVRTLSDVGQRTGSLGPGHWIDSLGFSSTTRDHVITVSQMSVIIGLAAWAAVTGHARLGLAATLLAVTQGWLNPWYAIWGVGLAAADEGDQLGRVSALVLCGYLMSDVVYWWW